MGRWESQRIEKAAPLDSFSTCLKVQWLLFQSCDKLVDLFSPFSELLIIILNVMSRYYLYIAERNDFESTC